MKSGNVLALCVLLVTTGLAEKPEKDKNVASFREAVEFFTSGPHYLATEHEDYVPQTLKKRAAKCNLTQEEAITEMSAIAREYRRLSEDSSDKVTDRMRKNGRMRLSAVIGFLAGFSDRSVLPLFEEMLVASNESTRVYAVIAYIKVAGPDSAPFIQKAFEKHPNLLMEYTVIEEFGRQLKKAKSNFPDKDLSASHIFLLQQVQEGKCRGDILDKVLCENLPDYSTSIQREMAAETMMNSENEYLRGMGNNIKTEIQKTPKEKRKDFRVKGEILDPARGK